MHPAETILAPTQQNAIALIEDFVHSGKPTANLTAPRGCGTTTLLKTLVQYQGFGDRPIQFIYRSVRSTHSPKSSLPCSLDRLNHRIVFLLDRSTTSDSVRDLASQSDQIQWIQAAAPNRFAPTSFAETSLRLQPLTQNQIRRFIDTQCFTAAGRVVRFADETIRDLANQSGGRLRDLMPLLQQRLNQKPNQQSRPLDCNATATQAAAA